MEGNTVVSVMCGDCVCTNSSTEGTLFPAATEMIREHFLDFRNNFIYRHTQTLLLYYLHCRIQSFSQGSFQKLSIFYLLLFNTYQVFPEKIKLLPWCPQNKSNHPDTVLLSSLTIAVDSRIADRMIFLMSSKLIFKTTFIVSILLPE